MKPVLLHLLRWSNVLLVLLTLLAYLAPFVNPAAVWHFSFLGLGYPFLLLANVGFVVFWALRRQRHFLLSAACILAGCGYLTGFFGWHFFKNTKKTEGELRVMTWNTASLKKYDSDQEATREEKMTSLQQLAETAGQLDILCVAETRGDHAVKAVREAFGFTHYYQGKGTIIFSKHPFVRQDLLPFGNTSNSCVWADLQTPGGIVRVYCAHLQSNRMSYTANKIATKGDLREEQTWKDIRFVLSRFKQGAQVRAQQAKIVASHAAKSPHPVLLCGDFNDVPVSYTYRVLSKDLQDSFREKGGGTGATFAGNLPFLRIDCVLASERFRILDHQVLHSELSDHFPVFVRLKMGD